MTTVDISGLDRVELLKELWRAQVAAGFFGTFEGLSMGGGLPFSQASAATAVTQYIDYFCGRAIKTDLSKDTVNPYLYDRDAGPGKFAEIVLRMRKH